MTQTKKGTVLLIDDSSFMLDLISAMLEGSEFEVIGTAKNGAEGLEKYKQLKPDLVLLDIVMPGETGAETLSKILEYDPQAKVIMVSSLGTQEKVIECLEKGAKNFLQKPFEPEGIIKLLNKVLEEK
jgi:two-component system chemotaxis response regulator CheY